MTPYYEDEWATIWHGDCREVLPSLVANVLVTDPPYGVGMTSFIDDFAVGVAGVNAAPGQRAAIFHSPRRIVEFVTAAESWRFERMLWMHKTADLANPWRGWHMNSEAIAVMSRSREGWPTPSGTSSDCYRVGPWERSGHPNAKPLTVVLDLVQKLAAPGDVIVDPFMGSGATLVAAKQLGRKSIGVELDERYCEIAARRLAQGVLDFGAVA